MIKNLDNFIEWIHQHAINKQDYDFDNLDWLLPELRDKAANNGLQPGDIVSYPLRANETTGGFAIEYQFLINGKINGNDFIQA